MILIFIRHLNQNLLTYPQGCIEHFNAQRHPALGKNFYRYLLKAPKTGSYPLRLSNSMFTKKLLQILLLIYEKNLQKDLEG